MSEYNHKQYIEWLNGELAKQEQADDKLLIEAKLSKYWKQRAARRAKNADREWPNTTDRNWALEQQNKSESINDSIQNIFQKELEESEEMVDDIGSVMRKIKKERAKLKMQREAAKLQHPRDATATRAKGKSLSVPMKPEYGGVAKGFKKKAKKLKKKGIAAAAPGETIGPGIGVGGGAPMEESKEKSK